jgi:hypothetical protein
MSIDLDAIKGRVRNAYLLDRDDGDALESAMGDVQTLVAEVERLREQRRIDNAEAARIYDFARDKGKALERAAVVAWLRKHWSDVLEQTPQQTAKLIERGDHRREED